MSANLCTDTSESIELLATQNLYLKPMARFNVSVQLPQLKAPGKSISNWEVMEKIKHMCRPHQFTSFKVIKSTLEFIRFEGETESKATIKILIQRLEGKTIKLSGFPDILKVRSGEAKIPFPSRHDWDSYFRDAKNMNEMKPGERPDTIHFKDLPSKWFADNGGRKDIPSEGILKQVFESYGNVRCVDIPMLDPYRKEMTSAKSIGTTIQTFTFGGDLYFEAFVQFTEYIGFVKAMTSLKGMKFMWKAEDGKAYTANVKIDFDKTKHLSDKNITKRRNEREKLEELEKQREEKVRKEREDEERKRHEERRKQDEEDRERNLKREEKLRKREERRVAREEKRKEAHIEQKKREEEKQISVKIALEERKILIAQRKLESIRLLTELFNRVKVIKQREEVQRKERELEQEQKLAVQIARRKQLEKEEGKLLAEKKKKDNLEKQERELRDKILKNMREVEERKAEKQREELRRKIRGGTRLRSTIVMQK